MTFDDYLNKLTKTDKEALEHIRLIIHQTVPNIEETISYGMPAFKYKHKILVYFAAFKDHLSFFPTSEPIKILNDKLDDFKVSKGTIQFTASKPIPEHLIKEIVLLRVKAVDVQSSIKIDQY